MLVAGDALGDNDGRGHTEALAREVDGLSRRGALELVNWEGGAVDAAARQMCIIAECDSRRYRILGQRHT